MKQGRKLLLLSLLAITGYMCQPIGSFLAGHGLNYWFSTMLLVPPILLSLAAMSYRAALPPVLGTRNYGVKLGSLVTVLFLSTVYGLINNDLSIECIFDLWPFAITVLFLTLGRHDQVWRDLEKPMIVLFWLAVPLVLWGLTQARPDEGAFGWVDYSADITSTRGSTVTLGYRIARLLDLFPIIFAMAFFRQRWDIWKILGVGSIIVQLGLQVYFQKRAPIIRVAAYIFMVVMLVPMLQKKVRLGTTLVVLVAVLAGFAWASRSEAYEKLMARFGDIGAVAEINRVHEASALLADFNETPLDYVLGRGMGGWYVPPVGWLAGTVSVEESYARYAMHIGILMPLLKGGLLLMLAYYAFFVPFFLPKPHGWYENRFNTAAMCVAPVYFLFLFMEGPPTQTFQCMLVGLCCARGGVAATEPEYEQEYYAAELPYYAGAAESYAWRT